MKLNLFMIGLRTMLPSKGLLSSNLSQCLAVGVACYLLTSSVVGLGLFTGRTLLQSVHHRRPERRDLMAAFAVWDGNWYRDIAAGGYNYNPHGPSRAVFFPLYPLLGRLLARLTGVDPLLALLLISHFSLVAAFCLLARYLRQRLPEAPKALTDYTVLSMGLYPPTLFFRMAYTESLFLLLLILSLYGMERKWPLISIAVVVGLATGTRAVGLALLFPFLLHVWWCSPSAWSRLTRLTLLTPLACWGILAFMLYMWSAFGEPLAFAKAENWWRQRPPVSIGQKLIDLATLEPVWSLLDPASESFWQRVKTLSWVP